MKVLHKIGLSVIALLLAVSLSAPAAVEALTASRQVPCLVDCVLVVYPDDYEWICEDICILPYCCLVPLGPKGCIEGGICPIEQ